MITLVVLMALLTVVLTTAGATLLRDTRTEWERMSDFEKSYVSHWHSWETMDQYDERQRRIGRFSERKNP